MHIFLRSKWHGILPITINTLKPKYMLPSPCFSVQPHRSSSMLQEVSNIVSTSVGGLDDLESSLNQSSVSLSSSFVTQVVDSCKHEAPTRRILRFFLWSQKILDSSLEDKDFNHAIRVLAEKKDHTAMQILISDLRKEGRVMETHTFSLVAETLVKLGREDEALGIFKNLDKFNCPQDSFTVTAIVSALCAKGHAKRAAGVVWHHKDKISGAERCIYRSLLYSWCELVNVKEARKVIQEMKSMDVMPDLFCYNAFLRCLCKKNLKRNPSGLVPEALNVMMEMRSYKIAPTSITYNVLLNYLVTTRRVKESVRVIELMKKSGCTPDWMSYYLVVKVLYLTERFGKGNKMVDEMIENRLVPDCKFYYDLIGILCGVERVNVALELFERMKRNSLGGYGPVYDVLIPKLCMAGEFEKGRELWDEAMSLGVTLCCSSNVLDPSITSVFKPVRKQEEIHLLDSAVSESQVQVTKNNRKFKMKIRVSCSFSFLLEICRVAVSSAAICACHYVILLLLGRYGGRRACPSRSKEAKV
ncbi:pentatricopeptide repeat-containing protein At5g61370, mitochondrial isoform X3 [Carica papaya]|uniref:pentatricopeptide repeat-containing protein At5g61370, mitochondrial isoform X3 n=1 Tax=Carica papaya TaxID=3649 RepID=UPI000B8CD50B|nr:pentatricopeptide repeat-containing protein At5g61370, mitochondrial isoform X3 [Carica papaya]